MKRQYEKPSMNVEMFEANEYIAACYTLKCNVGQGYAYYDNNGEPGYQIFTSDRYITSGYGCGETYSAKTDVLPQANAKWHDYNTSKKDDYDIFLWDKKHFTKVEEGWLSGANNAS